MSYTLNPNAVAILLEPTMEEDGTWDGTIKTSLALGSDELPQEVYLSLLEVATLMAVSLDVMEEKEEFYELVADRRDKSVYHLSGKLSSTELNEDSKTMGSA